MMSFKKLSQVLFDKGFPEDSFVKDNNGLRRAYWNDNFMDAAAGISPCLAPTNPLLAKNPQYQVGLDEITNRYSENVSQIKFSKDFKNLVWNKSEDGIFLKALDAFSNHTTYIFEAHLVSEDTAKKFQDFPFETPLTFEKFHKKYLISSFSDSEHKYHFLLSTIFTFVDLVEVSINSNSIKSLKNPISLTEKSNALKFSKDRTFNNAFYFIESLNIPINVKNDETWGQYWVIGSGDKTIKFSSEFAVIEYASKLLDGQIGYEPE
jgi:hypothetical protein